MSIDIFSRKVQRMINQAYRMVDKATHAQKLGCIIFDKKIISRGFSCGHKTRPNLSSGLVDKLHAEIMAIRKSHYTIGTTLVVVRGNIGKPMMARPCKYCIEHIKDSGIKTIIYSINGGYATEQVS